MTVMTPRLLSSGTRVLLCARQPSLLAELLAVQDDPTLEIDVADNSTIATERLAARPFDVCVVDATWDSATFASLMAGMPAAPAPLQVLRLTEAPDEWDTKNAFPVDIVPIPSPTAIVRKIFRAAVQKSKLQIENRSLKRQLQARVVNELIGHSDAANRLREDVRAAADEDGCVLIQGERGAGSLHAARVVHLAGRRALRPFLVLDCRVHSAESLERELLGEAASPMGAGVEESAGRLVSCSGGALLLKGVELLPVAIQRKLATILTNKTFTCPLTGKPRPLEVRLMASTPVDLAIATQEGHFHAGLYGRISTRVVVVPSLRERRQDIGLLTEHFLNRLSVVEGKPVKRLSVEALKALRSHDWPGNLRELENVIERAVSLDDGGLLTAEVLRPWIARPLDANAEESSKLSLREMERKLIETTFARCQGNREQTARLLQIGIRTLSGKLREYGYPPRGGPGSNQRLSKVAYNTAGGTGGSSASALTRRRMKVLAGQPPVPPNRAAEFEGE
jgi:DNA-binding NtrC family response regulator